MKKKRLEKILIGNFFLKLLTIMKLSLFIVCLTAFSVVASESYSQSTKLSLEMRNVSINSVLKEIEDKSEFRFFYSEDVDTKKTVSVYFKNSNIADILDEIFEGTSIVFKIVGRQIALYNNTEDKMSFPWMQQQSVSISGRVTDSDGQLLPGVTVIEKGTTNGTVTNIDGEYNLDKISSGAVLQFSFVGMKTQEIPFSGQSVINVVLENDAIGIEEVVAVGYGTMKRGAVTGAVSAIEGKELTIAPSTNTTAMMAGRLPGLIVQQKSGQPGNDIASYSIRGFGSALIIVDGVERNFTQLDPNEIESVTVLKDASASIYGSRAGNGVVLVTTKRGKSGAPNISFNSSFSVSQPTAFPDYVNAYQFASMLTQAEGGVGSGSTFSQEDIDKYKEGTEPGYVSTNWKKEVMREWAPQQLHNLNINGGNEVTKYYFNLGYLNQGSMWRSGDGIYQRFNISSNVDVNISKRLSAQFDISWRREDRDDPHDLSTIFNDLYFANPTVDISNWPSPELIPVAAPTRATEDQPVATSTQSMSGYIKDQRDYFNGSIFLKYELPVSGLSIDSKVDLWSYNRYRNEFQKTFEVWEYDYENQVHSSAGTIGENYVGKTSYRSQKVTAQLALRYEKNFNSHSIKGLLLNEMIYDKSDNFWASRSNLISSSLPYLYAGSTDTQLNSDAVYEDGRHSLVGRVNYSFGNKYLAEVSFRYDGSPRFAENKRWGFFPGVSLGWRISEESFMQDGFFNNLKLRASAGRTGRDAISDYDYLTGYELVTGINNVYLFGDETYTRLQSIGLANENITWEKIDLYNLGLDASILDGKFGSELDAFYRKRSGILATRESTVANTFGATLPAENINSLDNRGFEITLYHKRRVGDFSYNITANYSWSRAKWLHYEERETFEDADDERIHKVSGKWTNRTLGYLTDGFFNSQEEIDNETVDQDQGGNVSIEPGDIRYVDYNGDGIITERDKVVLGKGTTPESMFGINMSASYKGFDFSMLWQGASGFVSRFNNDNNIGGLRASAGVPLAYQWEYQWNPDHPEDAQLPAPNVAGVKAHNMYLNDMYIKDATYMRLKNVTFGYNLPKSFLNSTGIEKVRFFISGLNLLTFYDFGIFKDYDPEITSSNAQETYPIQRVFSAGVNVTL
ncbi:SusC/RagA family TonB-linked outer membrane protein [Maribellus comscasis]|uniref:SusC/RagA family TonB-linked outer membrane protein n=1 Tax=Maribellus comscasis TaxID=2681766 RepID=A0A6I6JX21_9BACT|nr:TonB-dependent receptor [Maribellus comscasis]QGY43673.1 SusC/RagA family TonB-linked outer membrane protein [Maribellus comscasis]